MLRDVEDSDISELFWIRCGESARIGGERCIFWSSEQALRAYLNTLRSVGGSSLVFTLDGSLVGGIDLIPERNDPLLGSYMFIGALWAPDEEKADFLLKRAVEIAEERGFHFVDVVPARLPKFYEKRGFRRTRVWLSISGAVRPSPHQFRAESLSSEEDEALEDFVTVSGHMFPPKFTWKFLWELKKSGAVDVEFWKIGVGRSTFLAALIEDNLLLWGSRNISLGEVFDAVEACLGTALRKGLSILSAYSTEDFLDAFLAAGFEDTRKRMIWMRKQLI